jgi:polysaccharide export outer membrane protein
MISGCGRIVGAIMLLLLVAGCSALTADQGAEIGATPASPPELRLAAGDKVRVIVFGEDKLSGEYQIDNSGGLSLPLAGTIPAAGLTKVELEESLTKKLKGAYLRDPKVTVDVTSFRPFYVLGEVSKPGEYPYRSGLNVLSAIAIAVDAVSAISGKRMNYEYIDTPRAGDHICYISDLSKITQHYPRWSLTKTLDSILVEVCAAWSRRTVASVA